MFSLLWLLYLLLISAIVAFFSHVLFFRKEELRDSTPVRMKIKYLKKHVPPTFSNGWQLKTVDSGLRVWQKNMCSSSPSWMPEKIYACSGIIPASQQEVINILKQPGLLMEWDPAVKTVSKVTMATDHDDISVSFHSASIITTAVQQIRAMFGEEANAVYSRHWERAEEPTAEGWFMSSCTDRVISAEGALWSCFLLSSIVNGADDEAECLVTLVVAPVSPLFASFASAIPRLTASRVAGLQDFCTHYKPDTSTVKCCESEATVESLPPSSTDDNANLEENTIASPASLPVTEEFKSAAPDVSSDLPEFMNSQRIEKMVQTLTTLYEGGEGTDSWRSAGNFKGVDILKRPAQPGERPWDTLKGTAVVSVPMHYVLAYIYSLDCRVEWDELFVKGEVVEQYSLLTKVTRMEYRPVWPASARDFCIFHHITELAEGVFCVACEAVDHENCPEYKGLVRAEFVVGGFVLKELNADPPSCLVSYITRVDLKGEVVEQYDPLTKVTLTEFKPVWPASGRDFCNLAIIREMADGLFYQVYEAVEHEKCPELRGLVRGEIIIGGFVVKELSSDPPSCLVTYITRVDLKGNLPARLVNRVTSSQPQAVAVLRDKLEALYQADVASNSDDMSQLQKQGVDLWVELMKIREAQQPCAAQAAEGEEKESMLEWNLLEKHFSENGSVQSSSNMHSALQASNLAAQDSEEVFPVTDENMQLPLDRHQIDFKTLGSQAAANLLGEVLLASKVEISMSEELSELASTERDWSYHSIEKDVVILRKISAGEKIHSFLGKGVMKVKPPAVWQAVRNHMTRQVYDKMLKETNVVRQIDEQTKILYLHHETTQCFVKQSRDFVVLSAERVEPERYILAAVSVDVPEFPPTKNIIRGKVYSSGWIIEPVLQNGQLNSMVSYLSQIDFGGPLPARLVNLIARRQPLCIAYLRDYLEKIENK